jgi:hypothetical protein
MKKTTHIRKFYGYLLNQSFLIINVKQLPTAIYTVKITSDGWNVSVFADLFILNLEKPIYAC